MRKSTKTVLVVVLIVLMVGSGALFAFALTRSSAKYDPKKVKLDIDFHTREEILTSAYKVYGDDQQFMWAAKTIIENIGDMPVKNFKIQYQVTGYTDWTSEEEYPEIRPGQTVRDYCFPSLDPVKIEAISTKTPVDLKMKYTYQGLEEAKVDTEKVYLLGKNDFIFSSLPEDDRLTFADHFDNYRFIAAFVTPNEETTRAFANMVAGGLETATSDEDAYNMFVRVFDAMRSHGIQYKQSPEGFWAGSQAQHVQYPNETLDGRRGTCIDLAIAYAALLEAVNVKAYVALIPGHAIPIVELPNSGDIYAIESTFVDKNYTLTHFPGVTSPEVTASECIDLAAESINKSKENGELIMVDLEYWWKNGVMPIW